MITETAATPILAAITNLLHLLNREGDGTIDASTDTRWLLGQIETLGDYRLLEEVRCAVQVLANPDPWYRFACCRRIARYLPTFRAWLNCDDHDRGTYDAVIVDGPRRGARIRVGACCAPKARVLADYRGASIC